MYINEEQLQEFLLDGGLVSKKDLALAIKKSEKTDMELGDVLVSEGFINEDDLRRTHAYILGIPFVDLTHMDTDFEVLSMIPEPIARRNNIVAFNQTGKELEVAMLNTDDLAAIDFVKKKTKLRVLPRLTDVASIKHMLKQYQKSLRDELGSIIHTETKAFDSTEVISDEDLRKVADGIPAVRVVDSLLRHAIMQNASDIHIEPQEDGMIIRYRIDGMLHDAMTLPKTAVAPTVARIKVLASLRLDEKRLPQDGRFRMEADGDRVSFRVSILPTYFGEKVVMRLLREDVSGFTLEDLGFHGYSLEALHEALHAKTGLILTTGPTGSGKTTTLYTMLDILNTPDVNISTIEDPIEYQMNRINQTQVRSDIGFTFSTGLRSLVRQDPDILMVGEIRDKETAMLAINAALTGHLVLSTLHTNSAAGAIPRLIDMGVEPFLLASVLRVSIGQRLVRTLCGEKDQYTLGSPEARSLKENADLGKILTALKDEGVVEKKTTWKNVPFYREKETKECKTGYKGRQGISEVLKVDEAIKEHIIKESTADAIQAEAQKAGMMTMMEDGIFKAAQGVTTIEEVLRVVSE